jgi:hypothetical protein
MYRLDGRQFRSDHAYKVQLARAIRRLSPASYRFYFDSKANIRSSCFKQLTKRTSETLGDMIMNSLGPAGLAFSVWVERRENKQAALKQARQEALGSLPEDDHDEPATTSNTTNNHG